MKKKFIYPIILCSIGLFLMVSNFAILLFSSLLALLLLFDSGIWLYYWLKSPQRFLSIRRNFLAFASHIIKPLLALALLFNNSSTIKALVVILGVLLLVSSFYQLRISKNLASPLNNEMGFFRISSGFSIFIAILSCVFIFLPGLTVSLANIFLASFFFLLAIGVFFFYS